MAGAAAAAPPSAPPEPGERIVVTGSRVGNAAGGVSILDKADIDRRLPDTLLDPLDEMAGVRAFSTGGVGGRSFLSIRGGEPNFTLVLLEGTRLNDPTNSRGGAFDFFSLDPALVERVELARDAGSPIHGSDALSGVVNVRLISPQAGETRLSARAQAGSGGETSLGAVFLGGWEGGGVTAAASRFDTHGLHRGAALERTQALARLRQTAGPVEARLLGLAADVERADFAEDSGGPRLAVNRALETGETRLRIAALSLGRAGGGALRPALDLSYSRQRDDSLTPAIAPGALPGTPALSADTIFSRSEAVAHIAYRGTRWSGTLGAGWLTEEGRSEGEIDFGFPLPVSFRLRRETLSAFGELSLRPLARLEINVAARRDDLVHGPGRWTARVAAAWQPSARAPLFFARLGEGYKLPSFYALGHPLIGNPSLRPERSRSLEVGLEHRPDAKRHLRVALFSNRFRDLIDFDPTTFTTVNRNQVRARGAEAEIRWPLRTGLTVAGAVTWLELDSPTPLRGRPEWQGSLRLIWQPMPALELSGAVRGNNSFHDSSIRTGLVRAEGHAEADLAVRYRLSRRIGFHGVVRNLTGSGHEEAVGFPADGVTVRAGISVSLF